MMRSDSEIRLCMCVSESWLGNVVDAPRLIPKNVISSLSKFRNYSRKRVNQREAASLCNYTVTCRKWILAEDGIYFFGKESMKKTQVKMFQLERCGRDDIFQVDAELEAGKMTGIIRKEINGDSEGTLCNGWNGLGHFHLQVRHGVGGGRNGWTCLRRTEALEQARVGFRLIRTHAVIARANVVLAGNFDVDASHIFLHVHFRLLNDPELHGDQIDQNSRKYPLEVVW